MRTETGNVGETVVLNRLLAQNRHARRMPPGTPVFDILIYDCALDTWIEVQVKSSRTKRKWSLGQRDETNAHPLLFYVLVDLTTDETPCWVVPSALVASAVRASHSAYLARGGKDNPRRNIWQHEIAEYRENWDVLPHP